jgi:serine/threonine protein kinase
MPLEDYEIKDVLAQSERTLVRRARRRSDGADVVLKSLTREYPSAREVGQFEFEYRILRKLQIPGVIRGLALERDGDRLSIVLEDFGGESLPSCASGKQDIDLFFGIASSIVRALKYVHEQNVIHRDIHPRTSCGARRLASSSSSTSALRRSFRASARASISQTDWRGRCRTCRPSRRAG